MILPDSGTRYVTKFYLGRVDEGQRLPRGHRAGRHRARPADRQAAGGPRARRARPSRRWCRSSRTTASPRCRCSTPDAKPAGMIHEVDLLHALMDGRAKAKTPSTPTSRRCRAWWPPEFPLSKLADIFAEDNVAVVRGGLAPPRDHHQDRLHRVPGAARQVAHTPRVRLSHATAGRVQLRSSPDSNWRPPWPPRRPPRPHTEQGASQVGRRDGRASPSPTSIVWCDGSEEEKHRLTEEAVAEGHPHPAEPAEAPGLLPRTARTRTTSPASSSSPSSARRRRTRPGPTNNWMAPDEAYAKLGELFDGSMKGRTMYVVPYVMGPGRLAASRRSASSSPTASTSSSTCAS